MSTVNLNPRKSPNMLTKQGSNQWVRLNVGGSIFLTTKTTLSRDPNSFLARLIQDSDLISDKVRWFCFNFYVVFIIEYSHRCYCYCYQQQKVKGKNTIAHELDYASNSFVQKDFYWNREFISNNISIFLCMCFKAFFLNFHLHLYVCVNVCIKTTIG